MQVLSPLRVLVGVVLVQAAFVSPASGQGLTRWGDFAVEMKAGSYQIGVQKRLSQAGPTQRMCKKCAHYFEGWVESDELEEGAVDRDVDTFALGYRFYPVTGDRDTKKKEGLAIFMRAGLTRSEIEATLAGDQVFPEATHSGYYLGMGFEFPITQSVHPDGELKPFWVSAMVSMTQNEIERDLSDLDYLSAKVGVRFIFPSSRDRDRAKCRHARFEAVKGGGALMLEGVDSVDEDAVHDLMKEREDEIEKLFESGKLKQPEECYEPKKGER